MALASVAYSIVHAVQDGRYSLAPKSSPDPSSYGTVATDIATLVSDGASPTQGHVNTLNTDWTAYKASIDAISADCTLFYDPSKVQNRGQALALIQHIERDFLGRF